MMTVGDRYEYGVTFPEELVASTLVTVEAGRIVFVGKFKTKSRLALPDRLQLHYLPLLGPPAGNGDPGPTEVPTLVLKTVTREAEDAYDFWKKARNSVFPQHPFWMPIVEAEADKAAIALGEP